MPKKALETASWQGIRKVISKIMIELSIYIAAVAALSAIILLMLGYILTRKPREVHFKNKSSKTEKENIELTQTNQKMSIELQQLTRTNYEQQEKITEQADQISVPAKYTFDPIVGICRLGERQYCTACLLKFTESPLGVGNNPNKCPKCGLDYSKPPRWVAIHQLPPDDPFSRIR